MFVSCHANFVYLPQGVANNVEFRESNHAVKVQEVDEMCNDVGNVSNTISCCDVVQCCATEAPIDGDHLKLKVFNRKSIF